MSEYRVLEFPVSKDGRRRFTRKEVSWEATFQIGQSCFIHGAITNAGLGLDHSKLAGGVFFTPEQGAVDYSLVYGEDSSFDLEAGERGTLVIGGGMKVQAVVRWAGAKGMGLEFVQQQAIEPEEPMRMAA